MSYHFLCKSGIRPARTEQFLVIVYFVKVWLRLGVRSKYSFPVGSGWVERIVISVGCKSASKVISRREQHILNLICYKSNAIR